MRLIITLLFLIITNCTFAQKHNEAYENLSIGWIKIYKYKGFTKPSQVDEKKYSIAQLSIIDSFANWMQASYKPKGSLGDIKKYVTPKKNLYNERYNEAVPHSYGANANSYTFLRQTNGKWQPYLNFANFWTIAANEIPLTYREIAFNTNKTCLFTLPTYDEQFLKEYPNSEDAKRKNLYAIPSHPQLKKYIFMTLKTEHDNFGHQLIILSQNNRFPFLHVTIGEAMQFAEDAFPVKYAEEKQTAAEQNSYNTSHLKLAMDNLENKFSKARAMIKRLREKYKSRMNEPAYLKFGGYSIQDLANGEDVFENGKLKQDGSFDKSHPLYRVDPEMQAKCSTDKPQWIVIKWFGGSMYELPYKHMHESIINNFDFDYVYNFFFDPEKVKGKQYKPLGPLEREEKTITTEKSSMANKNATDPSVVFFEDFSENATGQKPMGWKASMNSNAQYPVITSVKSMEGKWLEFIGHSPVTPLKMNYPLPQNFELSFDLAVPKDIPWGAKAFVLYLGTAKNYVENGPCINLRIRAGYSGRPGETSLECKFGSSYPVNVKPYYDATGFSNDKEINKVTVLLKKRGEALEYFLDGDKIAHLPKGVPPGTIFNWLQFMHSRSDGDTEKYYISNIKITKE
ncbi:MAG: hypothetical protein JNJ86_04030 [Chitinophagaceae bacterium]|nr:hypothetical protein [Chitinophagaceae bacterium]